VYLYEKCVKCVLSVLCVCMCVCVHVRMCVELFLRKLYRHSKSKKNLTQKKHQGKGLVKLG